MKLGFAVTNYNNSKLTIQLIDSIRKTCSNHSIHIVVVDNDSSLQEKEILKEIDVDDIEVTLIFSEANEGYFSGLNVGINILNKLEKKPDLMIIGNNDLVFDSSFFESISKLSDIIDEFPVICPDLLTLDGVHQNPHVTNPITKLRLFIWRLYYCNYVLSRVIWYLSQFFKRFSARKDFHGYSKPGPILAGYGACYILTPLFFVHYQQLWSPSFLMGEEFFLAKQIEQAGMRIYYEPKLRVYHHDHATISKVPSHKLWQMSGDSYRIYRKFAADFGRNKNGS